MFVINLYSSSAYLKHAEVTMFIVMVSDDMIVNELYQNHISVDTGQCQMVLILTNTKMIL